MNGLGGPARAPLERRLDPTTRFQEVSVAAMLDDQVLSYLSSTGGCWWSARRMGVVLPHAAAEIEGVLELNWNRGVLRRKRGVGGRYEYQARSAGDA